MSVTAVVLGYWPKRVSNVERIVTDLLAGSVVPERIIVVLQGHVAMHHVQMDLAVDGWFDGTVQVVRTTANFRTRAKFVAALLELADYYLLMDDDTSVGYRTVERLVTCEKMTDTLSGWCTGYWGVTLAENGSFMSGTIHQPTLLDRPRSMDGFHGRAIFADHAALTRMFQLELALRKDADGNMVFPHEGDDIILGRTSNAWLIPMRGDECFVDLDQCGEALQFNTEPSPDGEHYFELRDRFARHIWQRP